MPPRSFSPGSVFITLVPRQTIPGSPASFLVSIPAHSCKTVIFKARLRSNLVAVRDTCTIVPRISGTPQGGFSFATGQIGGVFTSVNNALNAATFTIDAANATGGQRAIIHLVCEDQMINPTHKNCYGVNFGIGDGVLGNKYHLQIALFILGANPFNELLIIPTGGTIDPISEVEVIGIQY